MLLTFCWPSHTWTLRFSLFQFYFSDLLNVFYTHTHSLSLSRYFPYLYISRLRSFDLKVCCLAPLYSRARTHTSESSGRRHRPSRAADSWGGRGEGIDVSKDRSRQKLSGRFSLKSFGSPPSPSSFFIIIQHDIYKYIYIYTFWYPCQFDDHSVYIRIHVWSPPAIVSFPLPYPPFGGGFSWFRRRLSCGAFECFDSFLCQERPRYDLLLLLLSSVPHLFFSFLFSSSYVYTTVYNYKKCCCFFPPPWLLWNLSRYIGYRNETRWKRITFFSARPLFLKIFKIRFHRLRNGKKQIHLLKESHYYITLRETVFLSRGFCVSFPICYLFNVIMSHRAHARIAEKEEYKGSICL